MKNLYAIPILALVAACAATPEGRAYQYGHAIKDVNDSATMALDFGLIDADTAAAIQAATRTATADLKRAVAALKAGEPRDDVMRILDIVNDALANASGLLGEPD